MADSVNREKLAFRVTRPALGGKPKARDENKVARTKAVPR